MLWRFIRSKIGLMPASQPTAVYRFGPFEADSKTGELRKHGVKLKLQELPFRLLVCLLERPGEVVTREELKAKLWPGGTFVDFERGLGTALNKVREALCDSAAAPRFIETIPRRGYRFIAEVEKVEVGRVGAAERPEMPTTPVAPPARKYAVAAYILGACVIVLAMGTAYARFQTRPAPLTDRDVLVLADFTNSTGETVFDGTLRLALAFQIEQSPFLKVLDDEIARQDLELMRRSPHERVTNELARDICVREADKAMLAGSIASLGKSYVIEIHSTNCQTGATLARELAEAADKEHVLRALATAAQAMRAKLGESLNSIQRTAPPESNIRVTTSSLDAFQAFAAGQDLFQQNRFLEAIPFLERATQLDPDLALAWQWLGVSYSNVGSMERAQTCLDRAQALQDRVSMIEGFLLTGSHYQSTAQFYKAVETYRLWARTYPRDATPVVFLSLVHDHLGMFEEALLDMQTADRMAPRRRLWASLLMGEYIRLDRLAEAKAVAARFLPQGLDNTRIHQNLLAIAYMENDRERAERQIQWFAGKPEEYFVVTDQAAHARMFGQLRKSRELLQRAADLARRQTLPDVAKRLSEPDTKGDALLGNCAAAKTTHAISPETLAFCGDPALVERSEQVNAGLSKQRSTSIRWNYGQLPILRAAAELGLGHPAEAIELLRPVVPYERVFPLSNYLRGVAYLRLHKGTEAEAEFRKILDHRGANWGPLYPLSYVGLARASCLSNGLAGDTAKARKAYEDFFALWKDADPDVPILIQARKEYAALPSD